jgi:hypothetical protein
MYLVTVVHRSDARWPVWLLVVVTIWCLHCCRHERLLLQCRCPPKKNLRVKFGENVLRVVESAVEEGVH